MEKKISSKRTACFLSMYLLIYFAPIIAIHFARHMPRLIGNFCFSFPQLMFPFNIMFWKGDPVISNSSVFFLVAALYLVMLGLLFSFVTRSVKKFQWVILFAFCFSMLSVVALNLVLMACGIAVETKMP